MSDQDDHMGQAPHDRGSVSRIGPLTGDWPRSIGYDGDIAIAVAAGAIEAPLTLFIAANPVLTMRKRPRASQPVRFIGPAADRRESGESGDP